MTEVSKIGSELCWGRWIVEAGKDKHAAGGCGLLSVGLSADVRFPWGILDCADGGEGA